jgi:hypothetical protein
MFVFGSSLDLSWLVDVDDKRDRLVARTGSMQKQCPNDVYRTCPSIAPRCQTCRSIDDVCFDNVRRSTWPGVNDVKRDRQCLCMLNTHVSNVRDVFWKTKSDRVVSICVYVSLYSSVIHRERSMVRFSTTHRTESERERENQQWALSFFIQQMIS